jgi:glycosyltransferase involved in cell wall biosynthesis
MPTVGRVHAVLLTQYFPPEIGAPQSRIGYLARRLRQRGCAVTVVTGMPNYPTGRIPPEWRGRVTSREQTEFGTVLRSWLYASTHRGTTHQVLNYLSFAASASASAPVRVPSADVVIWESPPLFLAPAAWLLARRLRARLVMNVSDLWPRSAVELGVLPAGGAVTRALQALEGWAYRGADLVTCQTDGIADGIEERCPGTPTRLFPNGVDLEMFTPMPAVPALRQAMGAEDGTVLAGYLGNFGRAQALEQLIEAAAILERRAPAVRIVLMGDGPRRPAVEEMLAGRRLANVSVLDPVAHGEVPRFLASLDIGIVPLAGREIFQGARPSKLFELLAMCLPVVYAGRGEGARLAASSGAAKVTEPEDPDGLAGAVAALAATTRGERRDMGRRGRAYVTEHFDRSVLTDELVGALEGLARL